jgi:ATP/maltotriose-dependent transcriptional regulator MalT
VERLRAQSEVTDLGGPALMLTIAEIETIVGAQLAAAVVPRERTADAARRIHSATGGWPAAVRLTLEALRAAPDGGREAVLDRLQRPEGPLFPYLAQEVLGTMPETIRRALAASALFERFSAPMLPDVGLRDPAADLEAFARRGLFLQPLPGDPGWYVLHGLVREYARTRLTLRPEEAVAIRLAAAAWLEDEGRAESALTELVAAGERGHLADFLDRHAAALVLAGVTRGVTEAAALLPPEARTRRVEQACGEAYLARGHRCLHACSG